MQGSAQDWPAPACTAGRASLLGDPTRETSKPHPAAPQKGKGGEAAPDHVCGCYVSTSLDSELGRVTATARRCSARAVWVLVVQSVPLWPTSTVMGPRK